MTREGPVASNAEWIRWGKQDPLWAVSTEPGKEAGKASAWTDSEFYATGDSDWQDFFRHWQQFGVNRGNCVEIGCGAGRLTRALSASFQSVTAVDVSPEMVAYAKKHVDSRVEFRVTDGRTLPLADGSVTAIFSTHVLQHLDSEKEILNYFQEFYRVLAPGGTLMVHLPLYEFPGIGKVATILQTAYRVLLTLRGAFTRVQRVLRDPLMRMTSTNAHVLHQALLNLGFHEIELRVIPANRNGILHPFVLARKEPC